MDVLLILYRLVDVNVYVCNYVINNNILLLSFVSNQCPFTCYFRVLAAVNWVVAMLTHILAAIQVSIKTKRTIIILFHSFSCLLALSIFFFMLFLMSLSLFLSAGYPAAANPTQAPEITQIGYEARYTISVASSIPTGVADTLGFSTIIVRVLDLSSATQNDSTYYVLVS